MQGPCTRYTAVTHPEDVASVTASVQTLLNRANSYILPVYARPPFFLSHGKGAYVWDTEGRKYLDFSAGIAVNALGHGDEGVAQVSLNDLDILFLFLPFPTSLLLILMGFWGRRTCTYMIRTRRSVTCLTCPMPCRTALLFVGGVLRVIV